MSSVISRQIILNWLRSLVLALPNKMSQLLKWLGTNIGWAFIVAFLFLFPFLPLFFGSEGSGVDHLGLYLGSVLPAAIIVFLGGLLLMNSAKVVVLISFGLFLFSPVAEDHPFIGLGLLLCCLIFLKLVDKKLQERKKAYWLSRTRKKFRSEENVR